MSRNRMKVLVVQNPDDLFYPLDELMYNDPRIVYHGTSSIFANRIEKRGWLIGERPYDVEDIKELCHMYETLSYRDSGLHFVLRELVSSNSGYGVHDRAVSFSDDYWYARDYATNPGGETIQDIISAAEELGNYIVDSQIKPDDQEDSELESNHAPRTTPFGTKREAQLSEAGKAARQPGLTKILRSLWEKYNKIISDHYPVVYAVRVRPEWFRDPLKGLEQGIEGDKLRIDLYCRVSVPSANIVAKINFPNGATPFYPAMGEPLPVPWRKKRFQKWAEGKKLKNGSLR